MAPLLTEDDAFNSNTANGFINYRIPSVRELLNAPPNSLDTYSTLTFELFLYINDGEREPYFDYCHHRHLCRIYYRRHYTPVIFELQPPVVYHGGETYVHFDPKYTQNLNEDLATDEMQFINAKIGGARMDFEESVANDKKFSSWRRNTIRGRVGDQSPAENHEISMLWESGNSHVLDWSALHCSYDNSSCYYAKTVPVIKEVSIHEGFTSGGQSLTVKGWGFNSPNIDAKVDGVPCEVTAYQKDQFTCEVGAAQNISTVDVPYFGQHGVRHVLVNSSKDRDNNWVWLNNYDDELRPDWTREESLALTLEAPIDIAERIVHNYKGWFVAPATTRYRFYLACDDHCFVDLDLTPGSSSNLTSILSVDNWTNFRFFWDTRDGRTRISEWYELEEGQHYYIDTGVAEGGGGDHLSVAVEIERNDTEPGHHHSMRETQRLSVNINNDLDTTRVTVLNPDDGKYVLNF